MPSKSKADKKADKKSDKKGDKKKSSSRHSTKDKQQRSSATVSKPPKEWKFTQWFKKMPSQGTLPDADVLSAVEFDRSGSYLATGDRGGRIVVLEFDGDERALNGSADSNNNSKAAHKSAPRNQEDQSAAVSPAIHYKFHCEFQSHDPEFDYVKSMAVDERINKIRWLAPTNNAQYMLSTNDKVVKLWKIYEKEMKLVSRLNLENHPPGKKTPKIKKLVVPKLETTESFVVSEPRRFYANLHEFAINSMSVNSDSATFLTADNLRINHWDLEVYDHCFNIVDMKPKDPMQQLLEVITCAEFHPTNCNQFLYGSNLGTIRVGDLRDRALCDGRFKQYGPPRIAFRNQEEKIMREVMQTITDCKFSPNGRYIVSRDYLTVKLWDVNMEKEPVETIYVHDYLRPKLTELYHSEYIFDNFGVSINAKDQIVTGGYNNYFHLYDTQAKTNTFVEASKNPICVVPLVDQTQVAKKQPSPTPATTSKKKRTSKSGLGGLLGRKRAAKQGTMTPVDERRQSTAFPVINPETLDYDKKVLQVAWHPRANAVAVAGLNNLFIYSQ